jgi:RNA polymerase sigma-70 factor (ECF subfamily)
MTTVDVECAGLVAETSAGSLEGAFEALLQTHAERAVRLASRFVAGDRAAAEDIAQEAFARAWRALPRFRGQAELSTWLYRVVVNEALSQVRRRKVRDGVAAWLQRVGGRVTPAVTTDPGLRGRIERAMGTLSANERAAFALVHLEGFTVEDTARIRGRRSGTIKSHLHRALAKLRRELATCWEEQR